MYSPNSVNFSTEHMSFENFSQIYMEYYENSKNLMQSLITNNLHINCFNTPWDMCGPLHIVKKDNLRVNICSVDFDKFTGNQWVMNCHNKKQTKTDNNNNSGI